MSDIWPRDLSQNHIECMSAGYPLGYPFQRAANSTAGSTMYSHPARIPAAAAIALPAVRVFMFLPFHAVLCCIA